MKGDVCIYVDDKTLRKYASENFKDVNGKAYEISAAIILKWFFEKINQVECVIGFKIKQKYIDYYKNRYGEMTVSDIKLLLETHKDEDSITDVVISPIDTFHKNKNSGWVIQLKRFGQFQKNKNTEGLIEFLDCATSKYTKSSAFLVILFDGHKGIDVEKVNAHFKTRDFPFSKILFININKECDDSWCIDIGEFFPNYGYNRYEFDELVNKYDLQ